MADTQPPKHTPAILPDPPIDPGPPAIGESHSVGGSDYAGRLRRALGTICEKSPTQARSILDAYFRFISPKMTPVDFPRTLRTHPRDTERSFEGDGNKWLILYFYVGNAVAAYQDTFAHASMRARDEEQQMAAELLCDARIRVLEQLASVDILKGTDIDGDHAKGFALKLRK